MIVLSCVVIIIAIVAATWFLGLWNSFITLVNIVIAGSIASCYFEPLADQLEANNPTYTYQVDLVSFWGVFFVSFAVMRVATDMLSKYRLKFNIWVEMVGRTVLSFSIAWIFICLTLFSLHTAPMPVSAGGFQKAPESQNFVLGPDRLWMGYLQSRSRGALAESLDAPLTRTYDTSLLHADDQNLDARVFDSKSDFIFKYHHRREVLATENSLRVNK